MLGSQKRHLRFFVLPFACAPLIYGQDMPMLDILERLDRDCTFEEGHALPGGADTVATHCRQNVSEATSNVRLSSILLTLTWSRAYGDPTIFTVGSFRQGFISRSYSAAYLFAMVLCSADSWSPHR